MRHSDHAEDERGRVLGSDRGSGEHTRPADSRAVAPVGDPQREQPCQRHEEHHREIDAEAVRLGDVHDGGGQECGSQQTADRVRQALADEVDDQDRRRAHRRGDRAPHHHVGDLVLEHGQRRAAPLIGLVQPHHAVQQVHRQRAVHEELAGHRRGLHADAQTLGADEDEMLVDVEVEVRRSPGQAVEAKRGRDENDQRERWPKSHRLAAHDVEQRDDRTGSRGCSCVVSALPVDRRPVPCRVGHRGAQVSGPSGGFDGDRLQLGGPARHGGAGEMAQDGRVGFARRPAVRAALLDDGLAQLDAARIAVPQRAQVEVVVAQVADLLAPDRARDTGSSRRRRSTTRTAPCTAAATCRSRSTC